ncbi:MAG: hypothetical protein FRX48_00492 [Lasallia pustulata]|uniref:Uncharacterized protein n=1 Tax=Lasallia pustulata TaxID=136370 RepID=A0A5M8Q0T8_9LECA|nr:MAG: hypothetical protein FRX48_00492 [Lasallia pustulata]
MFGSGFLEGTPTGSGVPRTVALPDDNPAAMSVLCYILHFQFDQDSMGSFKVFESLAVLVDKYQCAQALKPWTTSWIQRWPGSSEGEDNYFNMVHIAYAFDLPEVFHKATLRAFCDVPSTEVLEMEKTLDGARILPASLYPSIYRRQRDILDSFHSHFVRAVKPFLDYAATTKEDGSECVCDRAAKIGSYFISLTSLGLWPSRQKISSSTLASLLEDIERVTSPTDKNSMANLKKCNRSSCKMDFHNVLQEVV